MSPECEEKQTKYLRSFSLLQPKKKKNISHDAFGTKLGRVHMQKQDLSKLQTRKMKGLRKRKGEVVAAEQDGQVPKVAKGESWTCIWTCGIIPGGLDCLKDW